MMEAQRYKASFVHISRRGDTRKIHVVVLGKNQCIPPPKKSVNNQWVIFFILSKFAPHTLVHVNAHFLHIYLYLMVWSEHSSILMYHKHISCLIPVVLKIFLQMQFQINASHHIFQVHMANGGRHVIHH